MSTSTTCPECGARLRRVVGTRPGHVPDHRDPLAPPGVVCGGSTSQRGAR